MAFHRKQEKHPNILTMPDSPASIPTDGPIVSSPGHLHIATSQLLVEGRTPISVATGLANGFHGGSPNQPLSPGLLNGMQLPPTCGARQLSKLKRFLTTLQQFGSDISVDIGERVRGLIVDLVNNSITVEEFHQQLQDATNFPLRPFVVPFLKTNLPLLQQELLQCSTLLKPSPHAYLSHESLSAHERERIKTEAEEFGFERPGEKRKSESDRPKENGYHPETLSPAKRKCSPAANYEEDNNGGSIADQLVQSMKQDMNEWRNLETLLSYVISYVEKAKRSMAILQDRSIRDREDMASWARAMAADAEAEIKRRANELMSKTLKQTDDRVNEVKRRAEEAVTDAKRQAVVELKKAVTAAEEKANDALSQAHHRMDKAVQEARRRATQETSELINVQDSSKENCWNCGRKANETCSGCNVARYCGSFCQHKDWETHQKDCGRHAKEAKALQPQPQQQQKQKQRNSDSNNSNTSSAKSSPRTTPTAAIQSKETVATISTEATVSTTQAKSAAP